MIYDLLKICVSIFFNLFNVVLGGRLPPFGSAAVIVEEKDHYLVVELPRGRIVFPGGFMSWKERPEQTAEREGKEETGLDLHIEDLVGFYHGASATWFQMSNISFVYQARVIGGQLQNNVEGRPCWMSESELRLRLDRHAVVVLDDYLRHREKQQNTQMV
ncbi:MAG TPA: NUDIX hydrolase [Dictyobacter sp.]|jgi:ADP-ribose pyrophosphatase YjhB (NUDIX family)|nr:NUDIX hydrolase [Dictyobacter sp.]